MGKFTKVKVYKILFGLNIIEEDKRSKRWLDEQVKASEVGDYISSRKVRYTFHVVYSTSPKLFNSKR